EAGVYPAGDDRAFGVALDEVDDDLVADARQEHRAEAVAGPRLAHAHPARAGVVERAAAIPVELDLDPAVLIDVDLLAARADDRRCLDALDRGFWREPRRAIRERGALEVVAVEELA